MKLVSVIVPTFNSAKFTSKLCKSLLSQTHKKIEVVIVDNFSSDNTIDEIKKKTDNDQRFKYYQINNNGIIGKSRNYGIKKSTGEYLAFHDSDDFWYENKIQTSLNFIKNHDFTYHYLSIENKKNLFLNNRKLFSYQLSNKPFLDLMIKGNPISTSSVLCKKSLFSNNFFFSEEKKLVAIEDFDCWISLSQKKIRFREIPIVLGKYYMGSFNTSLKLRKYNEYKLFHIYNRYKNLLNLSQKIYAKNHFRYLLSNDLSKINLKIKYYFFLLFQNKIKVSKFKIILKFLFYFFKRAL